MIYLGDNKIGKLYLGDTEIGKAYLGSDLVFQKGGGPTPPPPPAHTLVFYEKLRFDGTAYIDTDIVPDAQASYGVKLGNETLTAAQRIFIVPANGTNIGAILSSSTTSTNRQFGIYYGSSSAASSNRTLPFSYDTYNFFLTPSRFGWGDVTYTITKGSNTPTAGLILGANTAHTGQAYTGTMGAFGVYGADAKNAASYAALIAFTPYRTLQPCLYDNEAGMWCLETNTFYGNTAGAGSLSVEGNIVTY